MKRTTLLILLSFLVILQSCSGDSSKQNLEVKRSYGFIEKVDSIVINKMNEYNIPGLSIGLVRNDSIVYAKGYGVRNIENRNPVSEHTIFHTASISKLFTASAIIKLVNEERLSLADKVYQLIPELRFTDERIKEITIKDLLNHTSGLPDVEDYNWGNNNQLETSLRDYVGDLELELESAPSSTYSYSNLGYNLLGYVIEKVTEGSFEDYLKTAILNPSEMISSDFRYFKVPDSLTATPYTKDKITGEIKERETYPYTREHAASSTLNASAFELSKWMISFLKESQQDLSGNILGLTLKPESTNFPKIGLGFQQYDFTPKHAVGHFGGENIGLVVLGNCDYDDDYRQEIIKPIVELMQANKDN